MPPVASEPKFAAHAPLLPNPAARSGNGAGPGLEPFSALLDYAPSTPDRPPAKAESPRSRRDSVADAAKASSRTADKAHAKPKDRKQASGKNDGAVAEKSASDKTEADKAGGKSAVDAETAGTSEAADNVKLAGEGELAEALDATEQAPADADASGDADATLTGEQKTVVVVAPAVVVTPDASATDEQTAPVNEATPAKQAPEIVAAAAIASEAADAAPAQTADADADAEISKTATDTPKATSKDAAAKPVAAPKSEGEAQQTDADPLETEAGDGKQNNATPENDADLPARAKTKPDAPTHRHARHDTPASTMTVDTAAAAKTGAEHAQPILNTQNLNHPAAAAAVQSAPAAAPQTAAVPVSGIAVEIAARALSGKNRFEIRLDPPELGRIDVRLDVDRHGHVTSRLVVERADTLDMLRRDAHSLERALQDAGLKTSDNGLQFALRDHAGGDGSDGGNDTGADRAQLVIRDDELPGIETIRGYSRIGADGGIDIRV